MMQYCLFATVTDSDDPSGERLVLPFSTVAALAGVHPKSRGFRAIEWVRLFERDVLPLDVRDYTYVNGRARTIRPEVHPDLILALRDQCSGTNVTENAMVWFVEGTPTSRHSRRAAMREQDTYLAALSGRVDGSHPAYPVVSYLLRQGQDCLQRVLNRNWPLVEKAVHTLPGDTQRQQATRDWCERVLSNLRGFKHIYYTDTARSPRLFACGTTIHQLPRSLRRIALAGGVECDLRACQLAIVAQLWDIPQLQSFLASGASIWQELLGYMQVPTALFKDIAKRSIYSVVFGMSKDRLLKQLAEGDGHNEGVGTEAAVRFFEHPLLGDLLLARSRQQKVVWEQSGAKDAFGRWIKTTWNEKRKMKDCPSVLAQVVQSYELRLMMSVLPVFEREEQLYLLSWLHDGVVVWCGNRTKAQRYLRKLCDTVRGEADRLGMSTWLEVKNLSIPPEQELG